MEISGVTAEPRGWRCSGKPRRGTRSVGILRVKTPDALPNGTVRGGMRGAKIHIIICVLPPVNSASWPGKHADAFFATFEQQRLEQKAMWLPCLTPCSMQCTQCCARGVPHVIVNAGPERKYTHQLTLRNNAVSDQYMICTHTCTCTCTRPVL